MFWRKKGHTYLHLWGSNRESISTLSRKKKSRDSCGNNDQEDFPNVDEGTNESGPLTLFSAGRISELYLRMEEQDRYCHFYTIHALFGNLIVECFSYGVSPGGSSLGDILQGTVACAVNH